MALGTWKRTAIGGMGIYIACRLESSRYLHSLHLWNTLMVFTQAFAGMCNTFCNRSLLLTRRLISLTDWEVFWDHSKPLGRQTCELGCGDLTGVVDMGSVQASMRVRPTCALPVIIDKKAVSVGGTVNNARQ